MCILYTLKIYNTSGEVQLSNKSITAAVLWDRFGIGVSGICAIHCLVFPGIISILPLFGAVTVVDEWLHPLFIVLLAPAVYFAIRRSHYDKKISILLSTGFILVLFGWLLGHFWLGFMTEVILTVSGSIILIIGHWLNYRHHRTCKNSRHNHHPIAEELENL